MSMCGKLTNHCRSPYWPRPPPPLGRQPSTPPPAPAPRAVRSVADASWSFPSVVRLVQAHAVHQCRVRTCVRLRRLHEAALMLLCWFLNVCAPPFLVDTNVRIEYLAL